jgi:hypothetical protein
MSVHHLLIALSMHAPPPYRNAFARGMIKPDFALASLNQGLPARAPHPRQYPTCGRIGACGMSRE